MYIVKGTMSLIDFVDWLGSQYEVRIFCTLFLVLPWPYFFYCFFHSHGKDPSFLNEMVLHTCL